MLHSAIHFPNNVVATDRCSLLQSTVKRCRSQAQAERAGKFQASGAHLAFIVLLYFCSRDVGLMLLQQETTTGKATLLTLNLKRKTRR